MGSVEQKITASITGVAAYVPDYILTNEELEQTVETTNEWIVTRCGVTFANCFAFKCD